MAFDIEALLDLWTRLPSDPAEAADAFRTLYTDPVVVNGAVLGADDLVARARALQQTFQPLRREVLDVCDAGDKLAVAFRLSGRQVGPLATAAGVLTPTGRDIALRVIDILTLTDGRISEITMVADELGALVAIDAARLVADG
ncbi:MAG TPA: ester cyclase [Propionibacteriaceae bacterium]|nr:ester cyclase [Propionibacteriaceae bacterium]